MCQSVAASDWSALFLTLKLASVTTFILLAIATPVAWWLAYTRSPFRVLIEALVALPLVLPPTVLGFYLLLMLSPANPFGALLEKIFGEKLVFSFPGLVVGSIIYSLPFAVGPLKDGFEAIGRRPLEVAATLGASPWNRFLTIALPLARPAYLTAAVLTFAHTLGEFGIVLMIGGNIPGRTQVLSTVIYNHVEALQYAEAHRLALGLVAFSFLILLAIYLLRRRKALVGI
jgi:molybdate transport system permease protein